MAFLPSLPASVQPLMKPINLLTPEQRVKPLPNSMIAPGSAGPGYIDKKDNKNQSIINAIRRMAMGGEAFPEELYLVGEKGPELFVPKGKGFPEVIGKNGEEVRSFPTDGEIIPNHELDGKPEQSEYGIINGIRMKMAAGGDHDVHGTRLGLTSDDFFRGQDAKAAMYGNFQNEMEARGVGIGGLRVLPSDWDAPGRNTRLEAARARVGMPPMGGAANDGAGPAPTTSAPTPTRKDWTKEGLINTIRQQQGLGNINSDQANSMNASLAANVSPEDVSKSGSAFWGMRHSGSPTTESALSQTSGVPLTDSSGPITAREVDIADWAAAQHKRRAENRARDQGSESASMEDRDLREAAGNHGRSLDEERRIRGQHAYFENLIEGPKTISFLSSPEARQSAKNKVINSEEIGVPAESHNDMIKRARTGKDPLFKGYFDSLYGQWNRMQDVIDKEKDPKRKAQLRSAQLEFVHKHPNMNMFDDQAK